MTEKSSDWIEWNGGDLPVARNAIVSVKMRAYAGSVERRADELRWWHGPSGDPHDIVAYRVVKP